MITKAERAELRSVVRQQFKVLRTEVDVRAAEMEAEGRSRIGDRFAARDKAQSDLQWKLDEIVKQTNQDVADAIRASDYQLEDDYRGGAQVRGPQLRFSQDSRHQMTMTLTAGLNAQVKDAKLRLDREEADLLRTLAVGALESEEARSFLNRIPTVGELVPAARLAEIEAQFGDEPA